MIRLASATISSEWLFSRLEGLSANARVDPGAKIIALQPFPTGLTSIRIPYIRLRSLAWATHQTRPNGLLSSRRPEAYNTMSHIGKGGVSGTGRRRHEVIVRYRYRTPAKICDPDAHSGEGTVVIR